MNQGIRNAMINAGRGGLKFGTNAPYSADDCKKYYADETKAFNLRNLKWSSNMVEADIQGIDYNDFYAYQRHRMRVALVIDPTTGQNLGSDWQRIMVEDPNVDYIPRGAKVKFNGNTWLVVNPQNVESVSGTAIIRRCNAIYHHLDYFGNVLSEPFVYGQGGYDLATTNDNKETMILMAAYQHCVMQANPQTEDLHHNRRMILGRQAYSIRGMQDFSHDVTEDENSVHIQFFNLSVEEPLDIDDMENHVAGGKTFKWDIILNGMHEMVKGEEQTLQATSVRMDDIPTGYHYEWLTTNKDIASVSDGGKITANASGNVTITCRLQENRKILSTFDISVAESALQRFGWTKKPPEIIEVGETETFEADVTTGARMAVDSIEYTFSGVPEDYYTAVVVGNQVSIACNASYRNPLKVKATWQDKVLEADIQLKGW